MTGRAPSREELVRAIEATGTVLPRPLDDDASLIRAGLLDSTALFEIVLWMEDRVAPGLDLTAFDLAEEWDTLAKLAAFAERHAR